MEECSAGKGRMSDMKGTKKKFQIAYVFCLPWLIGFVCFTLFPIGFMIYNSLTNHCHAGDHDCLGAGSGDPAE